MCYFCSDFTMTFFSLIIVFHINKQNNKNPPLDSANLNIGSFQVYFVFSAWLEFFSISKRAWGDFFSLEFISQAHIKYHLFAAVIL